METNYQDFLTKKQILHKSIGINPKEPHKLLFPFQSDIVKWALRRGRACVFSACGTGKTLIQLEWARQIPGDVLIAAPLAVAQQTVAEGKKIDLTVRYCRHDNEVQPGITITNYDMLEHFSPARFKGIVLDECFAPGTLIDCFENGSHVEKPIEDIKPGDKIYNAFGIDTVIKCHKRKVSGAVEVAFAGRKIICSDNHKWKTVSGWVKACDLSANDWLVKTIQVSGESKYLKIESIKILEYWSPYLDKCLDENNDLYFYDLTAEKSHSYSVNGALVHNSSLLKSLDGHYRNYIIQSYSKTPFRLACTATPAPNDHMELGNHAEFVGAMSRSEMLSMFFVHDSGDGSWRLKGHAQSEFWKWVCSWAVMLQKPSDLGYEDGKFILPALHINDITVEHNVRGDYLFPMEAITLQERIRARRDSISERATACAEIIKKESDRWIAWCNLNTEADELESIVPGSVQVCGSDSREYKEAAVAWFLGNICDCQLRHVNKHNMEPNNNPCNCGGIKQRRILISKSSIFGFGLNLQTCRNVVFLGLSDSWESYYQAIRRCWRFGQEREVNVYIITSTAEGQVVSNIKRKEEDAMIMANEMVKNMHSINEANIKGTTHLSTAYVEDVKEGKRYTIYLGDCVEVTKRIPDSSIGFSVFSPPFKQLFTYSSSERDMGNAKTDKEFDEHFLFLVKELGRVMMPGRLVAVHCFDVPSMKERDGIIGLKDFSNQIRLNFEDNGFVYHSRVTIWKDPVTQMQRTKALGLLHKTIRKDSSMARVGLPDYLIVMRKKGVNLEHIPHTHEEFSVEQWQKWASPVWMDINPSDTLQYRSVREDKDERHICPLQLEVIRRAIVLWSNPNDIVLSPFAGIGSEGVVAVSNNRRFIGIELKASYWKQAAANLEFAEREACRDLFQP